MTHDEFRELLEGYVEEALDRQTRSSVDDHLAGCEECRAILDQVVAVDLGLSPTISDRMIRSSVQRAIARTIFDAGSWLLAIWIVGWIMGIVVIQPMVIDRDGRVEKITRAVVQAGLIFNPGVSSVRVDTDQRAFSTWIRTTARFPVGSGAQELAGPQTRIGVFRSTRTDAGTAPNVIGLDVTGMRKLGEGTVVTAEVRLPRPVDVEDAQFIIDDPEHDTEVIWIGFAISQPVDAWPLTVGYPTCGVLTDPNGGVTSFMPPPSAANALDNARRALDDVIGEADSVDILPHDVDRLREAAAEIESNPQVSVVVITGPSNEVARQVEDLGGEIIEVIGIDFYNWHSEACGS